MAKPTNIGTQWSNNNLMLNCCTRVIKLRTRTFHKCNRDSFGGIRPVGTVSAIDGAIWFKRVGDAAVIVHHHLGVLPMSTELQAGAMIGDESAIPERPVVHIKVNWFSISVEVQ